MSVRNASSPDSLSQVSVTKARSMLLSVRKSLIASVFSLHVWQFMCTACNLLELAGFECWGRRGTGVIAGMDGFWRGSGSVVKCRSHRRKVRGSIPALVTSFHPWERCFTLLTPVHPAVFKMGTGRKDSERIVGCLSCSAYSSSLVCPPGG